jgi:regulator of protease activity HflC (stomatin/prohibitin superfamily)
MNWLVELLDRLLSWLPRPVLIDPTEGGIKVGNGKLKPLEGGKRYWYIPLLHDVKTFPVVEQTSDLPAQTLMTANKKPLAVSGIVAYEIRDVETILTRAHDVDDIVRDIGRAAIAEVVTGQTLQGILDGARDGTTSHELTLKVRARLRRYGIQVLRAALNEACPCTVVRIVGEGHQTLVPHPSPEET